MLLNRFDGIEWVSKRVISENRRDLRVYYPLRLG
jgi:hypothetical protein